MFPENIDDSFADWVADVEERTGIRDTMTSIRDSFESDDVEDGVTDAVVVPANTPSSRSSSPTATPLPYVEGLPLPVAGFFYDQIHDACQTVPREDLRVIKLWKGNNPDSIQIPRSSRGYFLVVEVHPAGGEWGLSSIYDTGRTKFNSLRLSSDIKDELWGAQQWCESTGGIPSSGEWVVESFGLDWTLYLVASFDGDTLPDDIDAALDGYYGDFCPTYPPAQDLYVEGEWHSGDFGAVAAIPFDMLPPFTFLVAEFRPSDDKWDFTSLNSGGNWRAKGPAMSSDSGELWDITITCPTQASRHQLSIESLGGEWSVYQVAVK